MNVGIIKEVEYRIEGATSYIRMDFSGFSAQYVSSVEESKAGKFHSLKIDLKIPRITKSKSGILGSLLGRKLNVRFKDGNDTIHMAGNASYPARLVYTESIGGSPGSWNGYNVIILCQSPNAHEILDN